MNVSIILLLVAVICWFLAAISVPSGRVSLGWLGMFFFGLSLLVGNVRIG